MFTDDDSSTTNATANSVTVELIQNSGRLLKLLRQFRVPTNPEKRILLPLSPGAITVEQVSGNHQFGYTNQETNYGSWEKLQNALVVRVVDGHPN